MKKTFSMLILSTFLLTGCSLPFVENQSIKIETYVSNNIEVIKTAESIDKELKDYLSSASSKAKTFDKESISERIQISKGIQTDLFKNISEQNTNQYTKELKTIYMKLINEYLNTYSIYEKAIKTEESNILSAAIKESNIKMEGVSAMYLKQINEILKENKATELESLTEIKTEEKEKNKKGE